MNRSAPAVSIKLQVGPYCFEIAGRRLGGISAQIGLRVELLRSLLVMSGVLGRKRLAGLRLHVVGYLGGAGYIEGRA